jgi:hypothetical protein
MFWRICVCVNIRFRALLGDLFLPLKRSTGHRVRRSVRVGPATAGNDVEDFGVTPDHFHVMTRNDLLAETLILSIMAPDFW